MQKVPGLNWTNFRNRLETFISRMNTGEIKLQDEDPLQITSSQVTSWMKAEPSSASGENRSDFSYRKYSTSHPRLIFEVVTGEGYQSKKFVNSPSITYLSLSLAELINGSLSNTPTFRKLQELFSVMYVFKPHADKIEVFREIRVNGIKEPYDSLVLSPDLTGESICHFALLFQRHVVDEPRTQDEQENKPQL